MGEKLGVYRFLTGQAAGAEDLFRRALTIDEKDFGTNHPRVAVDVTNLAVCLESTGRALEAEAMFMRAVEILLPHQEAEAGRYAIALGNLARTVARHGQFDEAEKLMRQAVAIDEAHHGPHHPVVAMHLRSLAELLLQSGRRDEAVQLLRRAREADEKAVGTHHPFVALDLRALLGALDAAEPAAGLVPLAVQVLEIDMQWFPDKAILIAQDRLALAQLLEWAGQMAEAARRYREVVEQHVELAPIGSSIVASAAEKLVTLDAAELDPEMVVALLSDASAALLRENGADDQITQALRKVWAHALRRRGAHAEGRQIELDDRERQLRSRVEHSPRDARAIHELAIFLKNERNDFEAAERSYRTALELLPNDAITLSSLALLLTSVRGQHDEAERLYRRAIELAPRDAGVLGNFASFVHNIRRQFDVAEGLYCLALATEPHEPAILGNYASLLIAQGKLDQAEEHIRRAWRQQTGRHDRISARILVLKAIVATLRGQDPPIYLGQLKTLFSMEIAHVPWPAGALRDALSEQMCAEDAAFYAAALGAIDAREGFGALEPLARWAGQASVALDQPCDLITEI